MTNELRIEILSLEKTLLEKKKQLFLNRLEAIANCSFAKVGISNIEIVINALENTWQLSYLHNTLNFNANDYANNEDSEDNENESKTLSTMKETRIIFGKLNKYFIKGGIKLNVYRNTAGELRVHNPDYEFDLDLEEQRILVREYSSNYNLPEWLAIKIMLYLSDNNWDDQSWINHLSVV